MFKHLIKLMWNKRRSNTLLFLEVLLAFVVLFGVYAFSAYNLDRYRSPLGFDYENSLLVRLDLPDDLDSAAVLTAQQNIRNQITELPEVEAASFTGSISPFSGSSYYNGNENNGFDFGTYGYFVDEHYAATAQLTLREGRWFTESDEYAKYPPIVVNGALVDEYFPNAESMLDSIIILEGEMKIIGVVENFKYKSNFSENDPLTFFYQRNQNYAESPYERMIVRTAPGRTAAVEEPIFNIIQGLTKNSDVVIQSLSQRRSKANRPVVIPLVVLTIISIFLLINIGLGLFGVLFTQTSRRRAEIGLRKAMGATPAEVTVQFVSEVLLVTGAALLLGTLFAVQTPLLDLLPIPDRFFYWGILGAIATILLIVTLCALIPSRQAAGLQPAAVLHEE